MEASLLIVMTTLTDDNKSSRMLIAGLRSNFILHVPRARMELFASYSCKMQRYNYTKDGTTLVLLHNICILFFFK